MKRIVPNAFRGCVLVRKDGEELPNICEEEV